MDTRVSYNTIFSRAVEFVIRRPVVWILTFIIVLGLGNISEGEFVQLLNPTDMYFSPLYYPFVTGAPRLGLSAQLSSASITPAIGLAMILTLWLGALVAQATLMLISAQAARGQSLQFSISLGTGVQRAWRLVVVNLLVFGVFYGLILIYVLAIVNSPTGKMPSYFEQSFWDKQIIQAGGQYSVFQLRLCAFFPLNALAFVVYSPLIVAVILEDRSLWHSLRFGWRLLWANFGRLIGFWAILLVVGVPCAGFLFALTSILRLLPADIWGMFNVAINIASILLSVFLTAVATVAGVQFYLDCAHRLRSSQQSEVRTQVTA